MNGDERHAKKPVAGLPPYGHLIAVLVILVVVAAAYVPPLIGSKVYYAQDTSDLNYVMLRSHVEDLIDQGFTAWCPDLGTGYLRAADPTYSIYSWRVILFLLVRDYNAQVITVIIFALAAGMGAYVLGLKLTGSWVPALYMGMVWPLSGMVIGIIHNIPYMASAAWLPWALASWFGISRNWPRIAASSACVTMIAVDGDLIGAGVTLGSLAVVSALVPPSGSRKNEAFIWVVSAVLFIGLTAIIWMTALSVLPDSRRAEGLDLIEASLFSLHPWRLANFFAPGLWGHTYDFSFWGHDMSSSLIGSGFWYQGVYLGLLLPLLALAGLARPHPDRGRVLIFALLAIGFAVLAFGKHSGVLSWLMYRFESLRLFRFPAKLFTWSGMFILCAAGLGLREFYRRMEAGRGLRAEIIVSAIVPAVALVMLINYSTDTADYIKMACPKPELAFALIKHDMYRLALFAVSIPALITALSRYEKLRGAALSLALICITALDMLSAKPAPPLNPKYDLYQPSKIAAKIKETGPGRLLTFDRMYYLLRVGPRTSARPNWGIIDGIEYTFAKTAIIPLRITELDNAGLLRSNGRALMRMLAASYVLSPIEPQEDWVEPMVLKGDIVELTKYPEYNLILYKTSQEHPRVAITRTINLAPSRGQAYHASLQDNSPVRSSPIVHVPMDKAIYKGKLTKKFPVPKRPHKETGELTSSDRILSVDRRDGDRLILDVELGAPGALVVRDYLMPGWRAQVDGEETPVFYADGVGRAVFLPAGRHTVSFSFQLPALKYGGAISAVALLLLISGAAIHRWRVYTESNHRV